MGLNSKQWLLVVSGIVSGLITGAALLTPLFGQELAVKIIAGLGVANIVLNSVGTALSGQGSLVKDVLAMPGIDKINVNGQANQVLASMAVDPTQNKISATPASIQQVTQTAAGQ